MKSLALVLLVVALGLVMVPAASAADPTPGAAAVADYVMVGCMVHPYLTAVQTGAEQAAKDLGVKMYYLSPVGYDATKQLEMIEDVMNWPGVKGIAVVPADTHAFDTVYQELQAKGIKLVVTGAGCNDTSPYPVCFAASYDTAGRQTAKHMAELMGHKGKVGLVVGNPSDENVNKRATGFESYMKESEPNIEIVVTAKGGDTPEGSLTAAESILSGYPDVNAISGFCQFCGVGPAMAVASAKRTDVLVSGYDDSPEILEAIRKGNAAFTVMQQPFGQGYFGIWVLDQMVKNGKVPSTRFVDTGITFVDKSNVDAYNDAVKKAFWDILMPYVQKEVMLSPEAAAAVQATATAAAKAGATPAP